MWLGYIGCATLCLGMIIIPAVQGIYYLIKKKKGADEN